MYYNQGGVLAVLLKGRRVAQFRLLSDASGKVMIGDQPVYNDFDINVPPLS